MEAKNSDQKFLQKCDGQSLLPPSTQESVLATLSIFFSDETEIPLLINGVIFEIKFMCFMAFYPNSDLVRFVWWEIKEGKKKKELKQKYKKFLN